MSIFQGVANFHWPLLYLTSVVIPIYVISALIDYSNKIYYTFHIYYTTKFSNYLKIQDFWEILRYLNKYITRHMSVSISRHVYVTCDYIWHVIQIYNIFSTSIFRYLNILLYCYIILYYITSNKTYLIVW